jgi:hypothetical protein
MKVLRILRFGNRGLSRWIVGGIVVCVASTVVAMDFLASREPQEAQAPALKPMRSDEPIQPIEAMIGLNPRKIDLGRMLFNDSQLSENNQVSRSNRVELFRRWASVEIGSTLELEYTVPQRVRL